MIGLRRIIDGPNGHDRYELKDRIIYKTSYFFRIETLPIDDIETWSIHPEMIFVDVVEIRRMDGGTWIWFDYKNDLIAILDGLRD